MTLRECVTDDLLDQLSPDVLQAVPQLAKELAVRESVVFLDGPGSIGDPLGAARLQRGPLMLACPMSPANADDHGIR